MDGGEICHSRRCGGSALKLEGWISPAVVVTGPEAPELPWLRQRKFLKVMNLLAMQSLQAVHEVQGMVGNGIGPESGLAASVEEVESGLRDWEESRELAARKWRTEQPDFAQIGSCLPPLGLIPRLPNSIAGHISREFQMKGPIWTSGGPSGWGIGSVMQGLRWIADGACESMVAVHVGTKGVMATFVSGQKGTGFRKVCMVPRQDLGAEGGSCVFLRGVQDWKVLPAVCMLDGGGGFAACLELSS